MDIDIIKLYLKLNLLDVLFKQHINTKMILNISCILLQIILNILSVILTLVYHVDMGKYTLVAIFCLLIIVILNNVISDLVWKHQKVRLQSCIESAFYLIENSDDAEKIKEYLVKHTNDNKLK